MWERFGNVRTYVEPFYGSGAVLLVRELELARLGIDWAPGQTIETVNDADCYVENFWRAVSIEPEAVAHFADYPVNEAALHARHGWLVAREEFRERMMDADQPEYFDAKIAGWWVWGLSCWIGSGWCATEPGAKTRPTKDGGTQKRRPYASAGQQGNAVHARAPGRGDRGPRRFTGEVNVPRLDEKGYVGVHKKRPVAGADNLGRGVHRQAPRANALGGQGIHGHRVPQKMPDVYYRGGKGTAGQRVTMKRPKLTGNSDSGTHSPLARNNLIPWFQALQERLRPVRVVCGDFERVTGKSVVLPDSGYAGLFFDPPYPKEADRHEEIYSVDCGEVAHRAAAVAIEWGKHPRVRVAFCGYEGSHDFPNDWDCIAWKAAGGYGGGQSGRGARNSKRERIWFSPACIEPVEQLTLGTNP